jgi:serine/threonine protein kinase
VQRFAREGELLASIDSPYVGKVFDHGVSDSYGCIAMEFFGRGDLAQRMNQVISADDAVLFLHNIACGLDAIHRAGVVHRDLKPGKIMFRSDGSMALLDFGVSQGEGADLSLTPTGAIIGTPYCMSPEQTVGGAVDLRVDLYAAGVIFYQMLTGKRAFTARNLPALLLVIHSDPIPRLPAELQAYQPVTERLSAKKREERYHNAGELIAALAELVAVGA